nr:hypothetical protein [Tanacetum cinerariifolium]
MPPKNKSHFELEMEAIHLILTEIGDEIYSTVDACKTAHEMWVAIERLQQGESLNIQDVKTNLFWEFKKFTSHDGETMESYYTRMVKVCYKLDEVSYHKLFDILKQYQKEVNELRAKRIAKTANPLALVATAQPHQDPYYQTSKSQKSYASISKASLPTRKPKRVKESVYYKEKMLLCKQAEKGVPLQAKQSDWLADTDEEIDKQELEAHYSYMAKIQEVPTTDSGTDSEPLEHVQYDVGYNVFANAIWHSKQPKSISNTCVVETGDSNVISDSPDMCDNDIQNDQNVIECDDERLLAQKDIDIKEGLKLKAYKILVVKEKHDELVNQSVLTKSHYKGLVKENTKEIIDLKLKEEKDIDKMISMEKQLKFLNKIVYKSNRSIQPIHMLAPKGLTFNDRPTFVNPMYLKKAQSEIPCLYAIPNDQFDPANRLVSDSEETLTLEREMIKAKRSSFKTKTVPSSKRRLNLLHMDLSGPMRVASINGKKYILVIIEDYSRYTWTLFLCFKDETPEVLKDFLIMIQRNLHALVISVQTDRGTDFLNKTLNAFFKEEGIEHQTSTPRTPEQNNVIERQNRTLVEAARTMLLAFKLSLDGENIDKMKEKGDSCILVGYSTKSKGYRVYNKRTRLIVESIHLRFDEYKEMSETSVANDTSGLIPQRQKRTSSVNKSSSPTNNSAQQDTTPTTNIHPTSAPSTSTNVHAKGNEILFKTSYPPIPTGYLYQSGQKDSSFELTAFLDSNHAECIDTHKSTSGGIQFLGDKLVSWMSKKQYCTAMSSAEAEYVALSASCAQVMWMRT